jgi:hypothetical protein
MKYTIFNKKSEEKKEVSFEDLQKIGNAFAIKANIDSNQAYYEDNFYVIYRANIDEDIEESILAKCSNDNNIEFI